MSQRLVFWWNSACRSIMPFVRELSLLQPNQVRIVVNEEISENRRQFGWDPANAGDAQIDILGNQSSFPMKNVIKKERNSLHVFGGFQRQPIFLEAITICGKEGIKYGVMAEAPINTQHGLRKIVKQLYLNRVVRSQTRIIASKALFMACLSGRRHDVCMRMGWPSDKIFPFGYFTEPVHLPQFQSKINDGSQLHVLCMGSLTKEKGVQELLEATALAIQKGASLQLEILGDGPHRSELKKQAYRLGLDSSFIRFHGFVSDSMVLAFKARADVLVCPGYKEPWGIRINEGLQSGLAILCSDRIGAADLVMASRAGLLFRSGDAGELADLLRWLADSPCIVKELKKNATHFSKQINPKTAAQHFLEICAFAVGERTMRPSPPWYIYNENVKG